MARITNLHLNGYKSQNVVEQLTGLDIFVGPMGVGKSSRPEGLALAQLGYIPGQSKKAEDIFKASAGDEMSVGLNLDNGFGFLRTFTKKTSLNRKTGMENISIKESISLTPSKGESNDTQRKARITSEIGDFSIHLDFSGFESLSPAKKREYLYGFVSCSDDDWSKDKVASQLMTNIATDELQTNNPEAYEATVELINKALDTWVDGLSVEDGVLAMLEWSKEQQTAWNAKQKDAQGAVRQLADLKNQLTETDIDIADKKQALNDLQDQLITVEKELSKGQEIREAFENRKTQIAQLKDKIAKQKVLIGPPDTVEIDAKLEQLNKQVIEPDYDVTSIDNQIANAQVSLEKSTGEYNLAQQERMKYDAQLKTIELAVAKASSTGGLCVISKLIACPKDFTPFIDHLNAEIDKLTNLVTQAKDKESKALEQVNNIKSTIQGLNRKRSDQTIAANNQRDLNKELNTKIADLQSKKVELNNDAAKNTNQYDVYVSELERLESTPPKPVPEMAILEQQKDGLKKSIEDLKIVIEQKETAKTTLVNMQTSMVDSKDAEYKFNAAKSLVIELGPNGIQGELLKGGLEPLREIIQSNFNALGIPYEFAFKTESARGNETFDFGWIRDGDFISFDTLSGGQRMLVLTALLVALLQNGDAKVKVLTIDEIQTLDKKHRALFLTGLASLQKQGKLDNVLLAGVVDLTPEEAAGWEVHDLALQLDYEEVKTA